MRSGPLSSFVSLGLAALALVVACDSVDEATHELVVGTGGTGGGGSTGGTVRPGAGATGGASSTGSGATGGFFYTCGGNHSYAGSGSAPGKGGTGNAEAGAPGEAGAPSDPDTGEAGTAGMDGEGGAPGAEPASDAEPIVCSTQPVNDQLLPLPDVRESWTASDGTFTDECAPNGTLVEYHCEYVVSCNGECVHQPTGNVVRIASPCPSGCVDGVCAIATD